MLNPITAICTLYCLSDAQANGMDTASIEQAEASLAIRLPALLFHYYRELGNTAFNRAYHRLVLPHAMLGEYIIIAYAADGDAVWGIAKNALAQHNPMVRVSRNFDAVNQAEVHWFDELPLAAFLLAQAITNGVHCGLAQRREVYDFTGDILPRDLLALLARWGDEIEELRQPHERFFQRNHFSVVALVSLAEDATPTALWLGSQDADALAAWQADWLD